MTVDIATLAIRVESLEAKNATRELEKLRDTGGEAEQSTNGLTAAARKLQDVLKMVAGAAVAIKMYELIKESTLLASRYNELGIVMGVVGRNAGHSAAQLAATEAALQKTGISALQSRDAITKLISANIDLSKATDLARLAQDAAVIGGMNSSEAFARLVKGIQSAEKETLETMGLNVNFQRSYDALAKSLGKAVKDLTTVEKTQAAVNAVMEKAPGIAGAYEASLTNAGKQMRSMERYIENLKVKLGQPFQNPFEGLIAGSTSALKLALENADAIRSAMEATIAAILPAMKVAAAYFALFVAAPAIYTAAAAALWPVISALAVYAMNVAIGQTATIGFNTALFGTSVAANLAAGSLTKLGLAANLVFAAFAGWQIGEYLDKQFVQARVAGEVFAGAILEAWEHIKFAGIVAFDTMTLVGREFLQTMATLFAKWSDTVATGLQKMGFEEKSAQLSAFATQVRDASNAQGTFASRTAAASAEHDKNLKVIRLVTQSRVDGALKENMLSEATRGGAAAAASKAAAVVEMTDAEEKALKKAEAFLQTLEDERTAIGATDSQLRMLRAAKEAATAPNAKLRLQIMEEAVALDLATLAWEEKTAAEKRAAGAKKLLDDGVEAIWNQVRALQAEAEGYGKTSEAMVQANIKKVQAQLLSADLSEAETRALEMQLAGLRALSTEQAKMTALKGATSEPQKLLDVMEALEDAAKSAAVGMADAFGSVGSAIGELTTSLAGYARTQAAISKQLAEDEKAAGGDKIKLDKARLNAAQLSSQAQMKSYGDMTGAAKGFFKENSRGYKAMESVEKSYRAFEMAMAIKTMITKSGLLTSFTGLFVASKATETAATTASVGPDVAASTAKGQAAALAAVAGQGQGDPYTAWPRIAAMAALMAGLGFMVSAGGSKGDTTAKDRQAAAGTGSVFGDFADKNGKYSAKSDSIARSIELSAANSSIELNYTQGMLRALLNIESSIGGLGNLLIRSGDVGGPLPGNQLGTAAGFTQGIGSVLTLTKSLDVLTNGFFGKVSGKVSNAVFGGNVKAIDGGITADKTTVGGVMAGGLNASSYVDTKKDGGWFRSDKYRTTTTPLGAETNSQITKVIQDMAAAVREGGKLLGFEGDDFNRRLNAFTIDLGKISSKDLSAEEFQKQLEAVFAKVGDDMARWAVGGLAPFQKVGEGYLETLVRIGTNYANLDAVLQSVGMTFGATGLSSIAAREELIALAGGIDELAGKAGSFANNFLTEHERLAPVQKYVTEQLRAMGLAGIDTREEFKKHVLGLNLTTAAGREQYAALMDLQEAFAKTHAATVDLTKSQQAIADERADLQDQLDELTMSSIQLLNKQRMALDASNRGLFDQIQAAKAAKEAQDAAKSSLGDMIGTLKSFGDSARALSASLVTGSLSTLTPEQQYAELERQYQTTRMAGIAGDTKAQSNFASIAQAYLTASQKINGGDARYSTDFAGVLRDSEEIAKWTTAQVDVAQASLDALNAQVIGIGTLNDTMLDVAETLKAMPSVIATPDYSRMGTSGTEALAAGIKVLTAKLEAQTKEIEGLRADQRKQTGDTITGITTAVAKGAEKVVGGIDDASTNTRSSNYKVSLHDY